MHTATTLLASILLVSGPQVGQEQPETRGLYVSDCVVELIYDVRVPALQPGLLKELSVDRGDVVEADAVLGRLDDREAQIRLLIAKKDWKQPRKLPTVTQTLRLL